MALVVDTDVVSFLFKNDTRGLLYEPHLSGHTLSISFQTLAELELWALTSNWGQPRIQRLYEFLRQFTIEYVSPALCVRWAQIVNDGRRKGRPIAVGDAWNASTALLLDVPLVTNNAGHFSGVDGLTVISER